MRQHHLYFPDGRSAVQHVRFITCIDFFENYEDVLGCVRATDFRLAEHAGEFAEAMAADCTVIVADHPDSAADEVISDAGSLVKPTVESLTETFDRALRGDRPSTSPVERAQHYDWDSVADYALAAYRAAADGTW